MEQSESALEGDFDACLSLATPARKACDVAAPAPPDTQLSAAKISLIEVRNASYGAAHRSCIVGYRYASTTSKMFQPDIVGTVMRQLTIKWVVELPLGPQ